MLTPPAGVVTVVCLLAMLGGSSSFILPAAHRFQPGLILRMGYLDDLSPQGEPQKKKAPSPKIKPSGGVVPSGRGPERSYLDEVISGGGNTAASDSKQGDSIPASDDGSVAAAPLKKTESWSGGYLTDFLSGEDDARTDIRNLLTQRSIQSFMFLLEQCRDPHSAKWIQEDFLQTGNLLDFHGTGAGFIERFGGSWDASLIAMIQKPKDTIIVSAKRRGRGHGGWSKNNPYLKERWVEIPIDIDPPNLASRILSVREQIADEWVKDLDILVEANAMILDSFFAMIRTGEGTSASGEAAVAFKRTAGNLMNDNSRFAATTSSPFRRSNFDLLYNLCTQAAIHRILREQKASGEERGAPFVFLRDFYTHRAAEYFDGDLQFGRADDFIDELLQTSPSLSTDYGKTVLVDPVGAAENIIKMRKEVAKDWKESMKWVREDHTGIQKALLSKQMQSNPAKDSNDSAAFQ